jgi:ATP-dependent Lon protease
MDLSDAQMLVDRVLSNSDIVLDTVALTFSKDMFIAVSMDVAYSSEKADFDEMLNYLDDHQWDIKMQIVCSFQTSNAFLQKNAEKWLQAFNDSYLSLSNEEAERLIKQIFLHWLSAMDRVKITNRVARPSGPCVQVFDQNLVSKAMKYTGGLKSDKSNWSDHLLEDALKFRGYRTIPDVQKADSALREISQSFENLAEPISRIRTSLVLASCMKQENFHIRPMLLLGEPGIGKTYLASRLGKTLGVPMEKISAGGAQGGFQITGSHSSWTDARPGVIFTVLAKGNSAAPVVLIDEVDKIQDAKYPVLPVLLDLLELETSRQFKDEYFEMPIDASKVIFILTANSLESVPAPLVSRCEVFNISMPGVKQRLRIIQGLIAKLCEKTGWQIQLNQSTAIKLAERIDLDLRKVTFLVEDAFARAIQARDNMAYVWQPEYHDQTENLMKPEARRLLH